MAETGDPVSGPVPPGGVNPSESSITNDSAVPLLKTSAELPKDLLQPEELRKTSSEVPCSDKILKDGSHTKATLSVPITNCVVDRTGRPRSIAEVQITDGFVGVQMRDGVKHQNEHPSLAFMDKASSSHRDLREDNLAPAKLSVQRCHSDTLDSPAAPLHCESGTVCLGKDQKGLVQSLVCKQAMQMQQSNTVTTFCRAGGSSSSGSPTQQGYPQVCSTGAAQVSGDPGGEMKPGGFAEAVCCGSHHHGAFEDTFAAYCHPQPIPAPAQLVPRLTGMDGDCSRGQIAGPSLLALPPLISSVSETGLDAKRLLRCCTLDCNWPGPLRHAGCQQHAAEEWKSTREAGTMTSHRELRNVGVQTGPMETEKPPQHVFPEVCLVEEKTNGSDKRLTNQKSPVKEVKWDAEGMTWEVYGASVDPEELGLAIQRHLELQIKEAAGKAAKLSRENTGMSQYSTGKEQQSRRRGVMAVLRPPGCCTRTTTAVD